MARQKTWTLTCCTTLLLAALVASQRQGRATDSIRQGPQRLRPTEHGIGRLIQPLTFTDINGQQCRYPHDLSPARLTVFCLTSTSCPLSRKYLPTLVHLSEQAINGVEMVLINPIATDSRESMVAAAATIPNATYVHDPEGQLSQKLGATSTTDTIVLDAQRTVVYHGAIDDQYGFGYAREKPKQTYLRDSIAAVLAGEQPVVEATDAPGCNLGFEAQQPVESAVTYHGRVSRIIQRHCLECHRKGGLGPFPLDTYEDVLAHAGMVETVVDNRTMPPWFAVEPDQANTKKVHAMTWANDRSLSDLDREEFLTWLRGGHPVGSKKNAPAAIAFPNEWQIGTPDAIWTFPREIPVKATGIMPYRYVTVETDLTESKWVQAIEIQPGNAEVVHHVIITLRQPGAQRASPTEQEEDGLWAGYVPGQAIWAYPKGYARYLPKGSQLVFQMHYTPNGTATTDRTRVGVIYADEPPLHEVRVKGIANHRIQIPPGAEHHREQAAFRLPVDATVLGFLPHMHLRGAACRYDLISDQGQIKTLLDIPRYDFNWQLLYRYAEPRKLHAGDTIRFTAWFDNSDKNPANPDPTKTVRWGQQTFEEMLLGYVEYFLTDYPAGSWPDQDSRRPLQRQNRGSGNRSRGNKQTIEAAFKRLDQNKDQQLSRGELPERLRPFFERFDSDQNDGLSLDEARRFQAQQAEQ